MQAVFSMSQLQYFQLSTIVELYKKNQETQKFCPLALIFHLASYLIFIAVLKSTYPERMVLVTQYKQYFHVSAPLFCVTCDQGRWDRRGAGGELALRPHPTRDPKFEK